MAKNLVIVESPAKAQTIQKFLGADFTVASSFGHVRDLPKKDLAVDIENDFKPTYVISDEKKKQVNELKKKLKQAETVWLATDEDREGEAIAWHLCQALDLKSDTKRIAFHEITKSAVENAIKNPRAIDQNLVDAQQARRVLDRLVGYKLSPVLWKKVQAGLSAGRVQSVAVRLIVEREREIENFEAKFSFKVTAEFDLENGKILSAELPHRFETADEARDWLEKVKTADFHIDNLEQKPAKRTPAAPFTTSTLQQAASHKLGFSVKQTMVLAQRLYEAGHITYMRTDSLNLAQAAIAGAAREIEKSYGKEFVQTRQYKTKAAGAQEAHEAIRPTNFTNRTAGSDSGQQKLYDLIWRRATASQMSDAKLEKTIATITISTVEEVLEARGEVVQFEGFLKVYSKDKDQSGSKILPPLKAGQQLKLQTMQAAQIYKRPPARYTEASLVKKLEELGIGRPSTYAPTISTIQDRGYVEKGDVTGVERQVIIMRLEEGTVKTTAETELSGQDRNKLLPTQVGIIVTDFLIKHFSKIVDYDFTANVEREFDDIAKGSKAWNAMIAEFYGPFHKTVEESETVSRAEAAQAHELGNDPATGKPITARLGRYGPMLQLGSAEDEEKPKFAPLPPDKKIDNVTLEEALELFKLPRKVGETEEGEDILANYGRFGPYVKFGDLYVSIKPDDPFSITKERALELIKTKKQAEAAKNIQDFGKIKILNGRFGPYITDGKKNAKIPKDKDPAKLIEAEAKELLDKAPAKKRRR